MVDEPFPDIDKAPLDNLGLLLGPRVQDHERVPFGTIHLIDFVAAAECLTLIRHKPNRNARWAAEGTEPPSATS
jgi:hypothetical protein